MVDTNVLVSGTIALQGFPARIVDAVIDGDMMLVSSPTLIDEYVEVMRRPHIARKYPKAVIRASRVIEVIVHTGVHVSGVVTDRVLANPDDDFLLACAVEGKADYLVSGDEHLTALGSYRGVKIVTPREFVESVL